MTTTIVKKVKTDEDTVFERATLIENGYAIVYESSTETTYIDSSKHSGSFEEFAGGYIIVGVK